MRAAYCPLPFGRPFTNRSIPTAPPPSPSHNCRLPPRSWPRSARAASSTSPRWWAWWATRGRPTMPPPREVRAFLTHSSQTVRLAAGTSTLGLFCVVVAVASAGQWWANAGQANCSAANQGEQLGTGQALHSAARRGDMQAWRAAAGCCARPAAAYHVRTLEGLPPRDAPSLVTHTAALLRFASSFPPPPCLVPSITL